MTLIQSRVLFAKGFRPFFLLAGAASTLLLVGWLCVLRGVGPVPGWSTPFQWHSHEMLFGFAGAAIAGFLLTSVPVWTSRAPLVGMPLAGLAGLWVLGRLAVFFASSLPSPWIAAVVDVAYFVALAGWVGKAIYASRSQRNYAFPLLLLGLAIANALTHLEAMGAMPGAGAIGMRLGVGSVVLLITILGGRLVPLFTGAALKRHGHPVEIVREPWADRASGPLVAAFFVVYAFWPETPVSGVLAGGGALTLALRARGWRLRESLRDPLLWSMHVAYLWIPVGLGAFALAPWSLQLTTNVATHALTVGAIGGMILSIMSRVALGHTGRPLVVHPATVLAYGLVAGAALTRTLGLLLLPRWAGELLLFSGALWVLAFGIFLVIYTPILLSPRADGKPG